MKLLAFSLRLRTGTGNDFAVSRLLFLGGMLHGAWEDQIHQHAPQLKEILGLVNGTPGQPATPKRYTMLPPPWAQPLAILKDGSAHLGFGVVLYGAAADHASELGAAFCHCPALRLGVQQDRIEHCEFHEHTPTNPESFPALSAINLHWITPLLLESAGQRTLGTEQSPPALLRVVRSIARRIRELEPTLAEQLGLLGREWIVAEESIRALVAQSADWQKVSWRYGSRTKDAPVQFSGQLGCASYSAAAPDCIPANIHALLQWGTWFGVGQRTALGQGFYRLEVAT